MTQADSTAAPQNAATPDAGGGTVAFGEAVAAWARIGVLSFGGPAGQIALMHRTVVDEKGWLSERQFLNALNFCMLLPGPEAMQLATYVGWRLHGIAGGLAAGLLFVLPGAAVVLALSMIYAAFGQLPLVEAIFQGVKAAVLVIVIDALIKIAKRALSGPLDYALAAASFVAIFYLDLPFPLIIAAAAAVGFAASLQGGERANAANSEAPQAALARESGATLAQTGRTIAIWASVWLLPLAALWLALGQDHVLVQAGVFFSKLAVVTFGGAYAVLAYMAQEVSQNYGWLTPGQMLDGLGLAETTPGPLILVTEFVGYLAAATQGGAHNVAMGIAGAAVSLWMTFAPCFLWIFAGAPYVNRLQDMHRVRRALSGVTAAVVGVILNLSIWFGLHVLFGALDETTVGPGTLLVPQLDTWDPLAFALGGVAMLMLLVARQGIATTLGVCAALSFAAGQVFAG